MANQGSSFRTAVERVAEQGFRQLDGHPGIATLLAYLDGKSADDEMDRLREHLSLCPSCCDPFLVLAALLEDGKKEGAPEAAERVAAWQRLQERLAQEGPRNQRPWKPGTTRPWQRRYLAAAMLLACLGFSLGVVSGSRSRAPIADVALVDLLPEGEISRGAETNVARVPEGLSPVVFILNLPEPHPFSTYRVMLRRPTKLGSS